MNKTVSWLKTNKKIWTIILAIVMAIAVGLTAFFLTRKNDTVNTLKILNVNEVYLGDLYYAGQVQNQTLALRLCTNEMITRACSRKTATFQR